MPVDYIKEDKIAVITLNRPEALNAVDPEMAEVLSRALVDFMNDDSLWCGIITGAGNAFSVGADVATMLPLLKQNVGGQHAEPPNIMRGLKLWKPLIAAVNGAALGGGLELALACDIRIASENAVLGFPEVTLGLIPGWGGTQRISRAVPAGIAAELLYTGRPISASRALQYGLVNKVMPRAELMQAARMMAESICRAAPLAVRSARQALMQGLDLPLERGLELERSLNYTLAATVDFDEGCRAHLEKRKPIFKGE
ncbi:MAG: enoyl-CoA hydratase-related protein [Dehalococcoidia bacterium]|nr:enoyl-CoA hydratase-related protein [Dehalococcoidia bacterium]MDD5494907.1 enoyl-CoA hydratase-related protein [Dehalococcoidia bacterium]